MDKQELLRLCEEEKRKCEQECDQAKSAATSDNGQNFTPAGPNGELGPEVDSEKQNSCVAPMAAAIGDAGMALAALAAAAAAMMAAKDASEDDKKEEGKPGENNPQCDTADAARISECNNEYVQKCTADMSAPGCEAFANRYCGTTPGNNGTADQPYTPPNPDTVVGTFSSQTQQQNQSGFTFDVGGEGTTSAFCSMVAKLRDSKLFCQNAANSECPTCKGTSAAGFAQSTTDQMQSAQNMCPNDPVFKDPAVQAAMNSTPSTGISTQSLSDLGTGAASDRFSSQSVGASGGGGGDLGGDASVQQGGGVAFGAVNEGGLKGWDMSVGGGGGGGGSNSSAYSVEDVLRDPAGIIAKKNAVAAATVTKATDVAQQYGPSVFSISSVTYQSLCSKNKLNCK